MEHGEREGTEASVEQRSPAGEAQSPLRRPYEAPRILRREQIVHATLVSGEECVFDPPPC